MYSPNHVLRRLLPNLKTPDITFVNAPMTSHYLQTSVLSWNRTLSIECCSEISINLVNVISPPFSNALRMFFNIINLYFLSYISFYVACALVICLIKYLLTYLLTLIKKFYWISSTHLHCVSKNVPIFKLSVTQSYSFETQCINIHCTSTTFIHGEVIKQDQWSEFTYKFIFVSRPKHEIMMKKFILYKPYSRIVHSILILHVSELFFTVKSWSRLGELTISLSMLMRDSRLSICLSVV